MSLFDAPKKDCCDSFDWQLHQNDCPNKPPKVIHAKDCWIETATWEDYDGAYMGGSGPQCTCGAEKR